MSRIVRTCLDYSAPGPAHIEERYRHLTANSVRHFAHLGRE